MDEPTSRKAVCFTHAKALVGGWRSCLGVSFSRASLPQQEIFDTHYSTPFGISANRKCKRYSANGHCLFSRGQASNITSFLLVGYTPTPRTPVVYGVSDLPSLPNRRIGDGDCRSATGVPRLVVRLDKSKVLSERKNFEWVGS